MTKKYKGLKVGGNPECRKCQSKHVNKAGLRVAWRKGVKRRVQAYECQDCGHQFRESEHGN